MVCYQFRLPLFRKPCDDGEGQLPPNASAASPIFGCVLNDIDGDGFLDLYVVQNFFGPQRETGYTDGGNSLLMRGNGAGDFCRWTPILVDWS